MMKKDGVLLIATILIWGTVWYAIKFQLGDVPVIVSVFYRILIAALALVLYAAVTGNLHRLPRNDHVFLFLMGLLLFSGNYYLFYIATSYIESGLVSIIFSTLVIINSLNKRLFFGERIDRAILLGGLVGVVGVVLLFGHELIGGETSPGRLTGIGLAFVATYMVSLGNLISARCSRRGIPVVTSTSLGLVYGSVLSGGLALLQGQPFTVPLTPVYLSALLYLSLVCTAIAFLLYLSLVKSAGPDKAALATLLFPVVALAISSVLESYLWTPMAVAGVALILVGSGVSLFGGRIRATVGRAPAARQ